MSLKDQIRERKGKILKQWYQEVLESYPPQARIMIQSTADRFDNPIGFTLHDGIREILAALIDEKTLEEIDPALALVIKLKAIQEKTDSSPMDFLYTLKRIIREHCGAYSGSFTAVKELLELEDRIDQIMERAQSIFVDSREKLLELQVNEMKNKTHMLRRMAGDL